MRFIEVSEYGEHQFLRLTGVKRSVFELMVEVVGREQGGFGRPRKLSVADQVLLALCYWREYRSQFHVASSFGISEATACRTIKAVEEILLGDKRFHLPGKKALHDGSLNLTVIVVDAIQENEAASAHTQTKTAKPPSGLVPRHRRKRHPNSQTLSHTQQHLPKPQKTLWTAP